MFSQIDACSIQQFSSLGKLEVVLLAQSVARLHLLKVTEALRPGVNLFFRISWKERIDSTDHSFGPFALLLRIYPILLHDLYSRCKLNSRS